MGQIRHGSATTTHAVRAAIQRSQASLAQLSREMGINPKTVAKWRKRATVEDMKTGPTEPRSTVLTEAEEAMIVAFRRHTLLPLDDCLYALQPSIPHLTRSALHRCLQRHGISRLPDIEGDKPKRQKFKRYPIGFFHIDIAEVQTAEGKLYLFVGIDRTSKFAVTQLVEKADRKTAWEFLQHMLEAVPYQVHTILTDNGIQFAEQPRNRNTIYSRPMRFDTSPLSSDQWRTKARLRGQRDRTPPDEAQPPLDQRSSGANEPHHQRRNRQALPLRRPQSAPHPSRRLHGRVQLCAQAEDPRRPHALRIHLQDLDIRAGSIHPRPDPPDAGTEHLGRTGAGPNTKEWRQTPMGTSINNRAA